jgi:hypothetical protein
MAGSFEITGEKLIKNRLMAASQLAALDDEFEALAEANRHMHDPASNRRESSLGVLGSEGLPLEVDRVRAPIARNWRNDGFLSGRTRLGRLDHR